MIIEDVAELKVLVNVFYALKFGIDDEELNRIVRSPIFGRMFHEAVVEMTERYKAIETIDNSVASLDDWELRNRSNEKERIIKYLKEVDSWTDMTEAVQIEVVKSSLSPFSFNDQDVKDLLTELKFNKAD